MRGKEDRMKKLIREERITPAYAGKRPLVMMIGLLPRDHPRVCGEKHILSLEQYQALGITPAYAGKSRK